MGKRSPLLALACYAIIITSLVIGIVALVRIDKLSAKVAMAAEVRVPAFHIKHNMATLPDGALRVESASLPSGVAPAKSHANRVEGRIYMLRVADVRRAAGDEGTARPVVSGCVAPIVPGARWRRPYSVIIDPHNDGSVEHDEFLDSVKHGINAWDMFLNQSIVANVRTDVRADGFDDDSPDGKNEIMLGFIDEPGVLAVTVVWGVFDGPVDEREIVEADMIFNLHYSWKDYVLSNIAPHEQGHALGMAHTDTDGATMYPSAAKGETHKRDPLPCEIKSLRALYHDAGNADNTSAGTFSNTATIPTASLQIIASALLLHSASVVL